MGLFGPSGKEIADAFSERKHEDELRRIDDLAKPYGLQVTSISPSGRARVQLRSLDTSFDYGPDHNLRTEVDGEVWRDAAVTQEVLSSIASNFADKYLDHLLGQNSNHPRIGWVKNQLRSK